MTDAAVILALGLVTMLLGFDNTVRIPGGEELSPWWHLATLLPMAVLSLAKIRRPVATLAAGTLVFAADQVLGGGIGVMLFFADLVYGAALRASDRARTVIAIGIAAATAGVTVAGRLATGDLREGLLIGLVTAALLLTPYWWGSSVRQQTKLARAATQRARDAEQLAALTEETAVASERARLARDLHDALAGNLSAIAIHAEAAVAATADRPEALEHRALQEIRSASVAAMREMHTLITVLHRDTDTDAVTDPGATSPARVAQLPELVERMRSAGLDVELDLDLDLGPELGPGHGSGHGADPGRAPLPAAIDQSAYRIVQESLANAAKHGAGPCRLTVRRDPDALHIAAVNALPGGSLRRSRPAGTGTSHGIGLASMRERARALGGTFSAGPDAAPAAARTWTVTACLPLEETP